MKRTVKKQFWFSDEESNTLKEKARMVCLSEASLIRLLVEGFKPKEKPDERFYEMMKQLSVIGSNVNQIAVKANALGFVDVPMLKTEVERWHKFQADIEQRFLKPEKSDLKWQ